MDFVAFVGIALVILALCVAIVFAYSQQTRQLQEIQDQLAKIESQKSDLLRQERAQILDPLILIESALNQSSNPQIDAAMLQQIDIARVAVKDINERLNAMREWMGPPFDLEWAEYLERMPTLKKLYLASAYVAEETPVASAQIVKE